MPLFIFFGKRHISWTNNKTIFKWSNTYLKTSYSKECEQSCPEVTMLFWFYKSIPQFRYGNRRQHIKLDGKKVLVNNSATYYKNCYLITSSCHTEWTPTIGDISFMLRAAVRWKLKNSRSQGYFYLNSKLEALVQENQTKHKLVFGCSN